MDTVLPEGGTPVTDSPHRPARLRRAAPAARGVGVSCSRIHLTLLLDSRVLRDQELNERRKQRFASLADVVHKLEEPQVQREFLL